MAKKNVLQRLRCVLVAMEVIVGIVMVIAMAIIISNVNAKSKVRVNLLPNDIIYINLYRMDENTKNETYEYKQLIDESTLFLSMDKERMTLLLEREEAIDKVSFYRNIQCCEGVHENCTNNNCWVFGIDRNYLELAGVRLVEGRGFAESDFDQTFPNVLIDQNAKKIFFDGEEAVGKLIEVDNRVFRVIGVVEIQEDRKLMSAKYQDYWDKSAPLFFMTDSTWEIAYFLNVPENVLVKAADVYHRAEAGKYAEELLNSVVPSIFYQYKSKNSDSQEVDLQEWTRLTEIQAFWVRVVVILFSIWVVVFFLSIFLTRIERNAHDMLLETQMYQQQINTYKEWYDGIRKTKKEMQSFHHDLENHVSVLQNICQMQEDGRGAEERLLEIRNYLADINTDFQHQGYNTDSGNMLIDSIIDIKKGYASSMGIEMKVEIYIPKEMKYDGPDIVVLVGNLLDNSIEACQNVSGEKIVKLKLRYVMGNLFVHMKNTYNGDLIGRNGDIDSETIETTKKETKHHGIGMQNIKRIVKKYNGAMQWKADERYFVMDIMLYEFDKRK